MIVPGILVYISFLISVCTFIVLKVLLISSVTVIVRAGGAIWLNHFATVLFTVCSAVTVECCVSYPCLIPVFGTRGWYPWLVPVVGTRGWYPWLVPVVGTRGWYPWLVPVVGTRGWYPWLIPVVGTRGWYPWLVPVVGTRGWYPWLVPVVGTRAWYPWLVPVVGTRVWYPCCVGVFALTERSDMGLYEVPVSMSLLGFGMGTMLANVHMCGIMLLLRALFNMLVRNASLRGPICSGV